MQTQTASAEAPWVETGALFMSLVERARDSLARLQWAEAVWTNARAYVRLLASRSETARGEVRRASGLARAARQQARWLAATTLALQHRANELALTIGGELPFAELDALRDALGASRLLLGRSATIAAVRGPARPAQARAPRRRERETHLRRTGGRVKGTPAARTGNES
jgi:hypothetical protein